MALGILWALKSTKASLGFPLMVLGLVGFRKLMDYTPKIFSQRDLFWLDNLMPSSNDKKDDEESEENIQKVYKILNHKYCRNAGYRYFYISIICAHWHFNFDIPLTFHCSYKLL